MHNTVRYESHAGLGRGRDTKRHCSTAAPPESAFAKASSLPALHSPLAGSRGSPDTGVRPRPGEAAEWEAFRELGGAGSPPDTWDAHPERLSHSQGGGGLPVPAAWTASRVGHTDCLLDTAPCPPGEPWEELGFSAETVLKGTGG